MNSDCRKADRVGAPIGWYFDFDNHKEKFMTLVPGRSLALKALVFGLAITLSVVLVELTFYPLGIARGNEPKILLVYRNVSI